MYRLFALIAAIGALVIGAMQLSAGVGTARWTRYDASEFMMAQKKGKTILVHVASDGCSPCRAQATTLEELRRQNQSGDVLFVAVDFDKEAAFARQNNVASPASVLVFKGMEETARSVAHQDGQQDGQQNRAALRRVVLDGLFDQP
ncbi:MAG: thioredoxin family protein [Pseudomonadota bacterium]